MILSTLDIALIIIFILITLGIGIYFSKRASNSTTDFFLGGRKLPWWVAGTSMVATTFAADTPLLITEIVAKDGISGNWLWWNGLIGGMLTTFFFARLWRKANILTDVEFSELRYTGAAARFLRGFKAVYLGVLLNAVVIAWVNLALGALLRGFFGVPEADLLYYYAAAMILVMFYTSLSGLLGVAFTDFIQFGVAMIGTIVLAVLVLQSDKIGGIQGLKAQLSPETLSFLPQLDFGNGVESVGMYVLGFSTFLAFVGFQWWASWYPGAEPGGGGYVAQRMMSTRNESEAFKSVLWFQIAHYVVRPFPWILVGLSAIILYPELAADDKKMGYVLAMRDFLPSGWRGLLLVAFLSAYMSTISTQLNWGSSYLINDLYQRFILSEASQKHLIFISRVSTFLLMLFALWVTSQMSTLEQAFKFMIEAGAGLGGVLILRWYWWRINAWSEITASLVPFLGFAMASFWLKLAYPYSFFFTVGFTTLSWLLVTFLTRPTPLAHLQAFYQKVKPIGAWRKVRESLGEVQNKNTILPYLFLSWLTGILLAYSALFLLGKLVFQEYQEAGVAFLVLLISYLGLRWAGHKANIFSENPESDAK